MAHQSEWTVTVTWTDGERQLETSAGLSELDAIAMLADAAGKLANLIKYGSPALN